MPFRLHVHKNMQSNRDHIHDTKVMSLNKKNDKQRVNVFY